MGIEVKGIGHIGILVSDFERSFKFYTETMGCKVTNRRKGTDGRETAFLRFDENHHDFVIATAPEGADVTSAQGGDRLIQQIAFLVEDREAYLEALAHLHKHGVKPASKGLVHGPEGGQGQGVNGSGSRSFYFYDPDGNRLEVYCDAVKVRTGEQFPREDIAEALIAFSQVEVTR